VRKRALTRWRAGNAGWRSLKERTLEAALTPGEHRAPTRDRKIAYAHERPLLDDGSDHSAVRAGDLLPRQLERELERVPALTDRRDPKLLESEQLANVLVHPLSSLARRVMTTAEPREGSG